VSSEGSADRTPQIIPAPNGLPLLRAALFEGGPLAHGFTTRLGGDSAPPFATLNLGRAVGDRPEHVAANRRRVLEALGRDPDGHVEAAQVHGRSVAVVDAGHRGTKVAGADALVTSDPAVTLAIHVADCVPLLFWDPPRGIVGAAHAGWRGTAAGVGRAVVETMQRIFGTDPGDLRAALGPAIGPDHYEVDWPVADAFAHWPWASEVLRPGRPGHWWLDLVEANRRALVAVGVPPGQIWASGLCTVCRPDLFFSYRREATTGRMGALVGLLAPGFHLAP